MQLTRSQLSIPETSLTFDSFFAPREAVTALVALAGSNPDDEIVCSARWDEPGHKGKNVWEIAAFNARGFNAVTASADTHWEWRRYHPEKPKGATVRARWIPWHQLRAVTLENVTLHVRTLSDDSEELTQTHSWGLHFDEPDPFLLTTNGVENTEARLATLVESIRRLSTPRHDPGELQQSP